MSTKDEPDRDHLALRRKAEKLSSQRSIYMGPDMRETKKETKVISRFCLLFRLGYDHDFTETKTTEFSGIGLCTFLGVVFRSNKIEPPRLVYQNNEHDFVFVDAQGLHYVFSRINNQLIIRNKDGDATILNRDPSSGLSNMEKLPQRMRPFQPAPSRQMRLA